MTTLRRFAITVGLRPDKREEYLALHASVWPDVESMLTDAHVHNFSIFVRDNVLFGYYEYTGDDHDADQARIAADPVTRQWWTLTDLCQERLAGSPENQQWAPMTEVWHLS